MKTVIAPSGPPPPIPKCFEHDWTPWLAIEAMEGEAWERKWLHKQYRECKACNLFQSR